MHFRLIFITIFNILISQSYYESSIGSFFNTYSARSLSLGSSSNVSDRSGHCLLFNPSNLSMSSKKGLLFNVSTISDQRFERRGMIVKDSFGDYLTMSDYVKNNSINSTLAFSAKYSIDNIGIGISSSPLNSFNYYYEEEIRGQLSSDDGEIFSRDPLLGYHIFQSRGQLINNSFGSSLGVGITDDIIATVGFAVHIIPGGQFIDESIKIDTTSLWYNSLAQESFLEENIELSDLSTYDVRYTLSRASFYTLGSNIKLNNLLINLSVQSDAVIRKSIDIDDLLKIFSSTVDNGLDENNYIGNEYIVNHLMLKISDIYKPMKINLGFSILNKESNDINFIANYELNKYNDSSLLSSFSRYSIAIDHKGYKNIPLRFGVGYQTSPFRPYVSSISSFTMGSGINIDRLTLDFGISYRHITYNFPDMFPVRNDYRPDLDIINESKINLLITLSYHFNG